MIKEAVITTFVGFLLGVLGSWLFWQYQVRIVPNVQISKSIAKGFDRVHPDKNVYRIKIHNFGNNQVINLQAAARIVERVVDRWGERWPVTRELDLRFGGAIPALGRSYEQRDPLNKLPPGAILVIEGEQALEDELSKDHRIMFTMSATDAISNMSVVLRQSYVSNDILEGDFPINKMTVDTNKK